MIKLFLRSQILPPTHTGPLVLIVSVVALFVAYTAEYAFGLVPCTLCVLERIPYGVALVLAGITLAPVPHAVRWAAFVLLPVCFMAGLGMSLHHVGVEQHWWNSFTQCGGTLPQAHTGAALVQQLHTAPPPACDAVSWRIFGFSAAFWNGVLSTAMLLFTLASLLSSMARRTHHDK